MADERNLAALLEPEYVGTESEPQRPAQPPAERPAPSTQAAKPATPAEVPESFASQVERAASSPEQQFYRQLATATRPGVSPLSWLFGFEREASAVAPSAIGGLAGLAGSALDPTARYADQSIAQLDHGIATAQEEIERLQGIQAAAPATDEFTFGSTLPRIAALQGDIGAMHRAIEKRTPGGQAATDNEQAGDTLLGLQHAMEHRARVIRGQEAMPVRNAWDQINAFMNRATLAAPPPDTLHRDDPVTRFAGMLGQLAGIGPAFAGGLATGVPASMGLGAEGEREQAEAAGATLEQQATAQNLGAISGALQALGAHAVFRGVLPETMPRTVGELRDHIIKSTAIGAVQGGAQQLASNIIAQTAQYDPKRQLTDGLWDSIWQNALVMGMTGAALPGASFTLRALTGKPDAQYFRRPPREEAPLAPAGEQAPAPTPGAAAPTATTSAETAASQLEAQLRGEAVAPTTGAAEQVTPAVVGELGKGITESLRNMLWEKVQQGETTEVGAPSNILLAAAREKAAGRLNTRADFDAFYDAYGKSLREQPTAPLEKQGETPTPVAAAAAPLARREVAPESTTEPAAKQAASDRTEQPTAPPAAAAAPTRTARQIVDDIVDRVGSRLRSIVWNPGGGNIPMRYQADMRARGLNPNDVIAFTDRATRDFWVNPSATEDELQQAIIRNFLPESQRGRYDVLPIASFQQHANSPDVANLLAQNPNADNDTLGLWDRSSRNVLLNVPALLAHPDPVGAAVRTMTHEAAGHYGLRAQFEGDTTAMNAYLDRAWNGLAQNGTGDQIAAQFGTNMEGLAKNYGLLNADQTLADLSREGRRSLAEEMLARFSEQFDPADLDRAPGVIQRAVSLIRDGFARGNGLNFDNGEAFDFLRNAYRAIEPERAISPEGQVPLAKRLGREGYGTLLESPEETATNQLDLQDAAESVRRPKIEPGATHGQSATTKSILSSSKRLLNFARANPDWALTPETVDRERFGDPIGAGEEHVVTGTRGDHVLVETIPNGYYGPYGVAVKLPDPEADPRGAGTDASHVNATAAYGYTGAHADQYLQSQALLNAINPDFQRHIEGIVSYPGDEHPRIITSRPELDPREWFQSDYLQRNDRLRPLGFEPLDDRTYYNRDSGLLLADLHSGNVWINKADPNRFVILDGFATQLQGRMLNHVEDLLDNNYYDRWYAQKLSGDLDARNAALRILMGADISRSPTPEELAAEEALEAREAAERGSANPWSFLMKREEGMDPEKISEARQRMLRLSMAQMVEAGGALGISQRGWRQQADIRNPEPVRVMAASPTGLLYDKVGKPIWDQNSVDIYSRFGGDVQKLLDYWHNPQFFADGNGRDQHDYVYHLLANDLRDKIADAQEANNPDLVQQRENALGNLNQRFKETGTLWGQQGVARKYADPLQSLIADTQAEARTAVDKAVRQGGNFAQAADAVRDTLRDVNQRVRGDMEPIVKVAQDKADRNANQSLPEQLADALAKEVTERARAAREGPKALGAVNQLFGDFKRTVGQLVREQGIELTPKQRQQSLATNQMLDALNNIDWFREAWDRTIAAAQEKFGDDPDMQHAFALADNAFKAPISGSQVERAITELKMPSVGELVTRHRSTQQAVIDTLSDYLVKNSNLSRADADAVQKTIDGYVRGAVDERTKAQLAKVIDQYGGKEPSGQPMSMQKLIGLIHMGAFDDRAVADALAPSFGLKTITPELAQTMKDLTDKLALYNAQGRQGWQTDQLVYRLNQAVNQWRQQYMNWPQRIGQNASTIFMGNILSGIPTHVIATTSDLFNGWGNIASRWWALGDNAARAAAVPKILQTWWSGLTDSGAARAAYIFKTGIDPTQAATQHAWGGTEMMLPQWLDPYKYVFRSITAAHAMMASAPERAIAWLYGYDQALEHGQNLDKAMAEADSMIFGGQGDLGVAQQRASNEGLAPNSTEYKLRVQELMDQRQPEQIRSVAKMYGTRSIYTQAPEGAIGSAARAVQFYTREQPWAKFIVPFTNIVGNVLNESINYSPLGFARYAWNQGVTDWAHFRLADKNISDEHLNLLKSDMLFKAAVGTSMLAGVAALQAIPGPGGKPILQIHGAGPSDPKKRDQLLDQGWSPMSLEFNVGGRSVYLPFEASPLGVGLGMIGGFMDGLRYEKYPDAERAALYSISNVGHVMMDRTFLRGLTGFLNAFNGADSAEEGIRNLRREITQAGALVPYAGSLLLQHAWTQFADQKLYQGGPPIIGDMLRNVPMMNWIDGSKPRLNLLGEPILLNPETKRYATVGSSEPVWQFLHNNDIFLSDARPGKINGQAMTEEQRYNFLKYRGEYLRQDLEGRLGILQDASDDQRDKILKSIESKASRRGHADVIGGRTD